MPERGGDGEEEHDVAQPRACEERAGPQQQRAEQREHHVHRELPRQRPQRTVHRRTAGLVEEHARQPPAHAPRPGRRVLEREPPRVPRGEVAVERQLGHDRPDEQRRAERVRDERREDPQSAGAHERGERAAGEQAAGDEEPAHHEEDVDAQVAEREVREALERLPRRGGERPGVAHEHEPGRDQAHEVEVVVAPVRARADRVCHRSHHTPHPGVSSPPSPSTK